MSGPWRLGAVSPSVNTPSSGAGGKDGRGAAMPFDTLPPPNAEVHSASAPWAADLEVWRRISVLVSDSTTRY